MIKLYKNKHFVQGKGTFFNIWSWPGLDAQEKKFAADIQVLTDQIKSYEELKIKKESEIVRLEAQVSRLESNVSDYKVINAQMEANLSKLMNKLAEAKEGSV